MTCPQEWGEMRSWLGTVRKGDGLSGLDGRQVLMGLISPGSGSDKAHLPCAVIHLDIPGWADQCEQGISKRHGPQLQMGGGHRERIEFNDGVRRLAHLVAAAFEHVAQTVSDAGSRFFWHPHIDDLQEQVTLCGCRGELDEGVAAVADHRNELRLRLRRSDDNLFDQGRLGDERC